METRVSSNIKQALTTDICFLKDVLGESVGENGMVHCLCFFLGPVYQFYKTDSSR